MAISAVRTSLVMTSLVAALCAIWIPVAAGQVVLATLSGRLQVIDWERPLSCAELEKLVARIRTSPDELVSNTGGVTVGPEIGYTAKDTNCTWSSYGIVTNEGLVGLDISLMNTDATTNGSYVFYWNSRDVLPPHLKIGKAQATYNSLAVELFHPRVAAERAHTKASKEFQAGNLDLAITYYDAAYAYVRLEKYLQGKINSLLKQKRPLEASDVYWQALDLPGAAPSDRAAFLYGYIDKRLQAAEKNTGMQRTNLLREVVDGCVHQDGAGNAMLLNLKEKRAATADLCAYAMRGVLGAEDALQVVKSLSSKPTLHESWRNFVPLAYTLVGKSPPTGVIPITLPAVCALYKDVLAQPCPDAWQ
jgi:hypothetical protein